MKKFRTKIVVVEAIQYDGTPERAGEIIAWTSGSKSDAFVEGDEQLLFIHEWNSTKRVEVGEWIVRGPDGEHRKCHALLFSAKYEALE